MLLTQVFRPDDRQLVQYVLGTLPEEERERLDQASIEDDAVADRLRIVEDDLVNGYVRRTLPGEEMKRFEAYYLASPRRRQQVRRAEVFLAAVERAGTRLDAARSDASRRARFAWFFSAAACAAIVIAGGALFVRTMPSRSRTPETTRAAVEKSARPAPSAADRSAAGFDVDQKGTESSVARGSAKGATRPLVKDVASVAPALVIALPPVTRAIAKIPVVPLDAVDRPIAFDLPLEPGGSSQWQVGLKDPAASRTLWRSAWLPVIASADRPSLRVVIPAGVLRAQRYWLEVSARPADGRPEIVVTYVFQVAAQ